MNIKNIKKEMFIERDAMLMATSKAEAERHYESACSCQSSLYPSQCNVWDCRYCYLTRLYNNKLRQLAAHKNNIVINGNVVIKGGEFNF